MVVAAVMAVNAECRKSKMPDKGTLDEPGQSQRTLMLAGSVELYTLCKSPDRSPLDLFDREGSYLPAVMMGPPH